MKRSGWAAGVMAVLTGLFGVSGLLCAGAGYTVREEISGLYELATLVFEDPEWAEIPDSDAMIRYLAAHPDAWSLSVCTVHDDTLSCSFEHRVDEPRPLASAVKVAVLVAYADSVAAGSLSPDDPVTLVEWQRHYLPGTDGGAHPAALAELEIGENTTLAKVVEAMISHSDNAATDLLLQRVGLHQVDATLARLDVQMDALHPLAGQFLLFDRADEVARSDVRREALLAVESWQKAGRPAVSVGGLREQIHGVDRLDHRVSSSEYAQLVGATFQDFPEASAEIVHHAMSWPMRKFGTPQGLSLLGTKGGALPGVLTEVMFAVPDSGPYAGQTRVIVLLIEDMSMAGWFGAMGSFAHQKLLIELAMDPDREAALRRALAE